MPWVVAWCAATPVQFAFGQDAGATTSELEKGSRWEIFNGYAWIMAIAFVVTLFTTPLMRKLAIAFGVIDRPSENRKVHRMPVAYLGGVAVFLGILAAILYSYASMGWAGLVEYHSSTHVSEPEQRIVPLFVLFGMTVVVVVGLLDDVWGLAPRVKIGGLLFAAALLAIDDIGARVAAQVLSPLGTLLGNPSLVFTIPLPFHLLGAESAGIHFDLVYWVGTAIIGFFVLGACNATNLIDGLDGLLTGTTAISAAGLLIISLGLAAADDGVRDTQRLVLCMALLGACLGFLPHNFNPATIFLGDAGSLLLGYTTIVIILTLGATDKTHLMMAGLIVFAVPLIDTCLAIVRRKMAGQSISSADSDHLHHMLKRSLGVKGAVLVLYAISASFATLGVLVSMGRARVVYIIALMLASFIGVTAIKIARRKFIEQQAIDSEARRATQTIILNQPPPPSGPPVGVAGEAASAR
ncbi:MAG: undecaprenyl/decaprenyl-phosphate alpha-N-acetylglucosaminyl 1-phosphate transferase [Phycisphaeraceae bacterium]|nr:undecaprenyl/decaprenyl-phosphate alpha-N-acetylglucosaminyl 1-phosphate transferase [Phycisphaeraceae bacterium]